MRQRALRKKTGKGLIVIKKMWRAWCLYLTCKLRRSKLCSEGRHYLDYTEQYTKHSLLQREKRSPSSKTFFYTSILGKRVQKQRRRRASAPKTWWNMRDQWRIVSQRGVCSIWERSHWTQSYFSISSIFSLHFQKCRCFIHLHMVAVSIPC